MAHCGCDPELEVSPSPLSFSLFCGFYVSPCLQFDRLLSKASLSGAYCLGPVAAWAAECSDTAWIYSFIIRQMGWSRCGPCGDSGAVWGVKQGPAASPLLPHPTVTSTEGAGCSWANRAPSLFHSLLALPPPFSSPFLLLWAIPTGGGGFCPKTHTRTQNLKDTSWNWQRLWNEGRLRSKINYLQLSGDTPVTFQR